MREERTAAPACRLCGGGDGNSLRRAREMFHGTREQFDYVECASCGTLQIAEVPDLARHYPEDYYSFRPTGGAVEPGLLKRVSKSLGAFVRRRACDYYCARLAPGGRRHRAGRWLAGRMKAVVVGFPEYLKDARVDLGVTRKSALLDVGSGAGLLLLSLREFGFEDLTGVDPFVPADITYPNGVRVLKTDVSTLRRQFDLVLANHCLEHVPDPRRTLAEVWRLLKPGRFAVVRVPLIARAWQEYGTDWVQLDAPRHLFLFTAEGFARLAAEAGFEVADTVFDSTAFQFWGSEQYQRDIPLTDARSHFVNPAASPFTPEQLAEFEARAAELNARGEGDQAAFYLRKI